jgi:hypothetical protein
VRRGLCCELIRNQSSRKTFSSENIIIDVDEEIILKWISGKWGRKEWTGCIWLMLETNGGPF